MDNIDFDRLHDQKYRLNNLYHIIDRNGNDIPFVMNHVQEDVYNGLHNRNVILKARQLGMSTWAVLYLIDSCIWEESTSCGIVSYSLEHAQHILKRIIGYALDHLPKWLTVPIKARSAREITFGNNSVIRVDTTLRGGAYQKVVVSEYGKTCARNPIKAEEVITGTLQTVPKDGIVIMESTGEGSDGYYADIVNEAALRGNDNLNALDYKLFFYNWLDEPAYYMEDKVKFDTHLSDYFDKIEIETNQKISLQQRYWYATQTKILGDKIKQEYPSTVSEAFVSTSEAYYFAEAIQKAKDEGRFLHINPYDALLPVYVTMDIGVNDLTVMTFFQVAHGETRIIDYYEDNNKGVDFYAKYLLQDKNYLYHTIFLPHDATKRDPLDVTKDYASEFRKLFSATGTRFTVLPRQDKQVSISHTKIKLSSFVFNVQKVKPFLDHCSKYRKKWSEPLGKYLDTPLHDIHSNYADCLIYTSQAVAKIQAAGGLSGAFESHKRAVENRRFQI